jgi:replicative DNA helicase
MSGQPHTNGQRPPPHNPAAERAVLGAMLIDKAALEHALVTLDAADFYSHSHRRVFDACAKLEAAARRVDPITVSAELATELADIGGATYLHRLIAEVPTVAEAATYTTIVADLAALRRLGDAGATIQQLAYEPGLDRERAEQIAAEILGRLATARPHTTHHDRLVAAGGWLLDDTDELAAVWGADQEVLWATGEALMIVGPQGVGKSTIAQQLALARIGLRDEVLGLPVAPSTGRLLYLACDRAPQIRRSFRRMVGEDDRAALDERMVIWKGPPESDFAKDQLSIVKMVKDAGADTVIIDSLKDVATDIHKDEGGIGYNRARQTALVAGVQIVELHHQRKAAADNKRPVKLDDVHGSGWLTRGAGSVALIWGEAGDPLVELHHLKQPAEPIGPLKLLHDAETGSTSIQQGADVLDLVRAQPGLTAADAARLIYDVEGRSPDRNEIEKARRRLDTLVRKGLARRVGGSKGSHAKPATYHPIERREEP